MKALFLWVWRGLVLFFLISTLVQSGLSAPAALALSVAAFAGYYALPKKKARQGDRTALPMPTLSPGAVYALNGVNDVLEVFENKVMITPKTNLASVFIRGLKGTKTIPMKSITALQFREAKPINGYIQFTLQGAVESQGGVIAAIGDENSVFFTQKDNGLAQEIRTYIESRILN